jgi:hypothetical protein
MAAKGTLLPWREPDEDEPWTIHIRPKPVPTPSDGFHWEKQEDGTTKTTKG